MVETKEWTFIDKSSWPAGPWNSEPDKAQWTDEATGLDCLVVRNDFGALCGYAGVTDGHPLFEVFYGACPVGCDVERWECPHKPESVLDAHGGITFSGSCQEDDKEQGICHVSPGGDRTWWFGFDCGHYMDACPGTPFGSLRRGFYRDIGYVREQCRALAAQLASMR